MFQTNVTGLINMTQAILPIFKARPDGGAGDIINIGSIAGREPYAGGSIYCATKAAVRAFTDALRKELIDTRIRVMEIDPGQVETVSFLPFFFSVFILCSSFSFNLTLLHLTSLLSFSFPCRFSPLLPPFALGCWLAMRVAHCRLYRSSPSFATTETRRRRMPFTRKCSLNVSSQSLARIEGTKTAAEYKLIRGSQRL